MNIKETLELQMVIKTELLLEFAQLEELAELSDDGYTVSVCRDQAEVLRQAIDHVSQACILISKYNRMKK